MVLARISIMEARVAKRIDVRPTQTSSMRLHRKRVVMQQTVKQSAGISSMSTHELNENMTIKMNSSKDSMLKDDQDNIQAKESALRQQDIQQYEHTC